MFVSLGWIDTIVLVAAVVCAIVVGIRAKGKTDTVESFLVGDRNLPWWAILGSIVATETSTATVLSLPATGYGSSGLRLLQITFGFLIGRTIVVYVLLPLFFHGKFFSAYEVLGKRFGEVAKVFASLLFLITRNLGDGLRLFLAAIVLQKLVGWSFGSSAMAIGVVTVIYTVFGGMRSIVWNDCIQLVIYLLGGIVTVFVLVYLIDGGWASIWEYAEKESKLTVLQTAPSDPTQSYWRWLVSDPFSLWAGLIGGAFLTLGTHGTDQMMVQRYLSARSQRDAGRAVFWSAFVVLFQFALFLFIGVQLACFYSQQPDVAFAKADEVYPHFIIHSFPKNTGLVGLMLAAILAAAMSTLSSSLNASASAVTNDFYLPWLRRKQSRSSMVSADPPNPMRLLKLSRWMCVVFGLVQILIGMGANSLPSDSAVISHALTIAGYSSGLLLGLFGLGSLTQSVRQWHALAGAAAGLVTLLCVQFVLPGYEIKVAWPWFAVIGSLVTFGSAFGLSLLFPGLGPRGASNEKPGTHEFEVE